MTTVGFGDITPQNVYERLFTAMVMMLGILFYSYMVGTLTNLLGEFDKRNTQDSKKMEVLEDIAKELKLHFKLK